MPPRFPKFSGRFDKALLYASELAVRSGKLSDKDKAELRRLITKGRKKGKQGWSLSDRTRCLYLVRKAGPEDLKLPEWMRRILGLGREGDLGDTEPVPIRSSSDTDPLERLMKLGDLRDREVVAPEQFELQRAQLLADQTIAAYGEVDHLDRLSLLGDLKARQIITEEQFDRVRSRILDASSPAD